MEDIIVVRHSTPDDVEAVVALALRQWKIIYEGYRSRIGEDMYAYTSSTVEANLAAKGVAIKANVLDTENCFVTEVNGKIAGFAHGRIEDTPRGKIGIVGHNAVDGEFRGRGIAGKQYAEIFKIFRANGCVAAKVHTGLDDGHAPARRAYNKAGFERNLPNINYFQWLTDKDPQPVFDFGDMIIRHAKPDDAKAIGDLAVRQWTHIYNSYRNCLGDELFAIVYGDADACLAKSRLNWEAKASDTEYCFVAEIDGKIAGFASYRTVDAPGGKLGIVGYNAVDGEFRGRGIAGKLYAHIFRGMIDSGCKVARVHTGLDDGHAPARRAYEKAGFGPNLPDIEYYQML